MSGSGVLWRSVPGWPLYEVSNTGLVRRAARGPATHPGRLRKVQVNKRLGYVTVLLHGGSSRHSTVTVSRAVLEAFVGPPPSPEHECNHRDGDKTNNYVANLEWVTPSENMSHSYRTGLHRPVSWERQGLRKLDPEMVAKIREKYAVGGVTQAELANEYGVCQAHISDIITGRRGIWSCAEAVRLFSRSPFYAAEDL